MNDQEFPNIPLTAPHIENIEIMELLGKGGMSLVYKARQKQLDRIVAVKVLSKVAFRGEEGIKRFQNEARLTSALDHPNIVKTISFGVSDDGQPYLVMEYLEGLSLADELKQNGRLKLQKFKDVFLPALSALGQAHQAGLIHRDIKPGNIMLCRSHTGAETVKLVDFGIAKVFGEGACETQGLTSSGAVLGSPTYMSPEQCQGMPLDGRSDLYSMACVMYETLSGEPPFSGDSLLEVMQKHSIQPPPTVSELSRKIDVRKELATVTLWGLAKDPAARPQTASEFARKLNEVLERITLDKVPSLKKLPVATIKALAQQPITVGIALLCVFMIAVIYFVLNQQVELKTKSTLKTVLHPKVNEKNQIDRLLASPDSLASVDSLEVQAVRSQEKGNWPLAERLWKRSLEIKEKKLKPYDLSVVESLTALAYCYYSQGKYAEAEPVYKRSLAIREKVLEPDNLLIAISLAGLGDCNNKLGKYAEAEPLLKRSLAIEEKVRGPNSPHLVDYLKMLALCYEKQGKHAEAKLVSKRAGAIESQSTPDSK